MYITVWVQGTWVPKPPLMDLILGSKSDPSSKIGFFNYEEHFLQLELPRLTNKQKIGSCQHHISFSFFGLGYVREILGFKIILSTNKISQF